MAKQLDADLKKLLTKQEAQEALTEMQMSAEKFSRQAGSLSAGYSSACKELTESISLSSIPAALFPARVCKRVKRKMVAPELFRRTRKCSACCAVSAIAK